MARSIRSSADRRRALIAALAVGACVAGGSVVEWVALPAQPDPVGTGLDLATGLALCVCGIASWLRRPDSRIGPALLVAGVLWFAGTAAPASAVVRYAHRGPLIYVLLAFPARGTWRRDRGAIALAAVAGAAGPFWSSVSAVVVWAALLAVWAAGQLRVSGWLDPPRDRLASWSAMGLAAMVAGVQLLALVAPSAAASIWLMIGYDLVLVAIAAGMTARLAASRENVLADLVLELGSRHAGTVRDRLADALDDPTVEIAYALDDGAGYVDERGRPVAVDEAGSSRAATAIQRDGTTIALILHDRTRTDDPDLVRAIEVAATLLERHATLAGALAVEISELDASRRRLALAAAVERERIDSRLSAGPIACLRSIETALEGARDGVTVGGVGHAPDLERAMANVREAIRELTALGRGLRPPRLVEAGLGAALTELAREAPLPVDLHVDRMRLPADVEVAVYFVSVEAMANVAKHAHATRASMQLRSTTDLVTLVVADDGVGGASPNAGRGLRGLADRVRSLGGNLEVSSGQGQGTVIRAAIPLPNEAGGAA